MINEISVRQMHDENGKNIINEFIITLSSTDISPEGRYYQSHDRRIAAIIEGKIYLDETYYDRALPKSVNLCNQMFLLLKESEIKQHIECGLIKKIDLN